jgi:hypothetical protein
MAVIRAGSLRLPSIVRRRAVFGWGTALTAGIAAVSWRYSTLNSAHTHDRFSRLSVTPPCLRIWCWTRAFSAAPQSTLFSAISNADMSSLTPPQPPPPWNHTTDDIAKLTKDAIAKDRDLNHKIAKLKEEDCNFDSVSRIKPPLLYLIHPGFIFIGLR